jgi:uncharacterized protein YjbJ (UPF0337 family)
VPARAGHFPAAAQDGEENLQTTAEKRPNKGDIPASAERRFSRMTTMNLKGHWNEIKGKLKQKYGQLTDDDLTFAEGKEEELLGRLQKRLGRSKEDVRAEIERL